MVYTRTHGTKRHLAGAHTRHIPYKNTHKHGTYEKHKHTQRRHINTAHINDTHTQHTRIAYTVQHFNSTKQYSIIQHSAIRYSTHSTPPTCTVCESLLLLQLYDACSCRCFPRIPGIVLCVVCVVSVCHVL